MGFKLEHTTLGKLNGAGASDSYNLSGINEVNKKSSNKPTNKLQF